MDIPERPTEPTEDKDFDFKEAYKKDNVEECMWDYLHTMDRYVLIEYIFEAKQKETYNDIKESREFQDYIERRAEEAAKINPDEE